MKSLLLLGTLAISLSAHALWKPFLRLGWNLSTDFQTISSNPTQGVLADIGLSGRIFSLGVGGQFNYKTMIGSDDFVKYYTPVYALIEARIANPTILRPKIGLNIGWTPAFKENFYYHNMVKGIYEEGTGNGDYLSNFKNGLHVSLNVGVYIRIRKNHQLFVETAVLYQESQQIRYTTLSGITQEYLEDKQEHLFLQLRLGYRFR